MAALLLTVPQAAARLQVSPATVRRLTEAGALEAVQVSPRKRRIRPESVDRLERYGYHAAAGDAA